MTREEAERDITLAGVEEREAMQALRDAIERRRKATEVLLSLLPKPQPPQICGTCGQKWADDDGRHCDVCLAGHNYRVRILRHAETAVMSRLAEEAAEHGRSKP